MEKQPKFIKEFSKEESVEERQKVAQTIKAKRADHFSEKSVQIQRRDKLQETTSERELGLSEQLKQLEVAQGELAELSTSGLREILNYFQIKKLKADMAVGQKTWEELKEQQDTEIAEEKQISEKLDTKEIPPKLHEAKKMLENFYKGEKKKWADSECGKEDIEKYFTEEHLASLSLEDYVTLLKRFPSEMVAHVTRQGIRDHIGMIYHGAGEGAYTAGFMKMVEDGRLRSPLGVHLLEGEKEEVIQRVLYLDKCKSKEDALQKVLDITDGEQDYAGSYTDKMAVHFATEEVADCYYGSENGNEIFIIYPSAYIASQYYFHGQLNKSGGGYWNDQWVWAHEEKGMDLNAGVVFIPEEARVDKNTGSRYELDENKNSIENSEYKAAIRKVVDSNDFYDFAKEAMKISGELNQHWNAGRLSAKNVELLKKLEPFRQKLEQEFGITEKRLQFAILESRGLCNLSLQKEREAEGKVDNFKSIDTEIDEVLKREGILYAEAKDTISSKEFWEAYFSKNLSKRPSKIVYYKGQDPTNALAKWQQDNDLYKKAPDSNIGFPERHVKKDSPEATVGLDRFRSLAIKGVEDYFAQKETELS